MRKAKEPRPTLASQWNMIPDGTITGYTPHTVTIDTPKRKDTVIRKNDIAIQYHTIPIPLPEPKPQLIHMVACKTVGEYKRNQEKIRKFCLEEAKAIKKAKPSNQRNSPRKTHPDKPVQQKPQQSQPKQRSKTETKWTKDKLVKLATHNQSRQQSKSKTQPRPQSA